MARWSTWALIVAAAVLAALLVAAASRASRQAVPDDQRCQGLTLKGVRCRNPIRRGEARCWRHRHPVSPRPVALPI